MIRFSSLLAACAVALLSSPVSAAAQDAGLLAVTPVADSVRSAATSSPDAARDVSLRAGPTVVSGIVGVRAASELPLRTPPVAVQRVGRNPALMIVGGVAIVIGGIIGDDAGTIIMVGGAVVGLIGLWNFLR